MHVASAEEGYFPPHVLKKGVSLYGYEKVANIIYDNCFGVTQRMSASAV